MTVRPDDVFEEEEVDVEECVKAGRKPPLAKRYRIRIDREKFVVTTPLVTKTDLLGLVKKSPEKWRVHQKLRGGQMDEVKDGETVDLREKGVERFVTMELSQTDGEAALAAPPVRRAFRLPEDDEDYLNSIGLRWEAVESKGKWVLIHNHPLPAGYLPQAATMAIRIEGGYPPAKLDMVYFLPAIARADGKAIPALSTQELDGATFQRWSRHYAWRDGIDSLVTHYLRCKACLVDELKR
ncbi:MAG: multiubiquitin domain-containing protein [Verrucomicrobiales bacterium]|nr:multiubiquitin domain-containing protein [Verrucomicrobiales bacterium]